MKPRMLPKIRVTVAQKMALIDYMSEHRRLARFEYDADTAEVEWLRLAETLNQTGTVKPVEKWKVTWRDLKRKSLREVQLAAENNKSASAVALKIKEIVTEPQDGEQQGPADYKTSQSSANICHEESYQGEETETVDLDQSQNLEHSEGPVTTNLELESIECTPDFSSDSSPCVSPSRVLIKTRSNQDQINTLVDCMAINPGMAFGNQMIPRKMADWMRLRQLLNRMGPSKRTAAWQQSWRDLKRNALERYKIDTKSKSPLSKKILDIIVAYNKGSTNYVQVEATSKLVLPPQLKHLIQPDTANGTPNKGDNITEKSASPVNLISVTPNPQRYHTKTRSTNTQILALVDYMDKHPALAIARSVPGDTECPFADEWRKLSLYLNRMCITKRSTMAWKRTWSDLKLTARKEPDKKRNSHLNQRILEIVERAEAAQNDTGPNTETNVVRPLSADFDQLSTDHLSLGQLSDRSSPRLSGNGETQQDTKRQQICRRYTNAQKHALVDYMSSHLALATAKYVDSNAIDPHCAEWRQLNKYLNKIGPAKSTAAWKRTWRGLKSTVLMKSWSNKKLIGVDRKILDIVEKNPIDLQSEIAQESNSIPELTKSIHMPSLHVQPLEQTQKDDISICDPSQGDPANQKHQYISNNAGQISPGKRSAMSPKQQFLEKPIGQKSREMSPDLCSFGTESPEQRSEQDSLLQSENDTPKDAPNEKRRLRCTPAQTNALVNYIAKHPHLIKGKCLYTNNKQDPTYDEWRRLSRYLNRIDRSMPVKSVANWKKTWRCLVIDSRRKDRKRSKWKDMISRKILEIQNENMTVKDIVSEPEDYAYPPSSASEEIFLSDPLKSEQDEDIELRQEDRNARKTRRRTNIRRSSNLQLRALADHMIAHPELALNHSKLYNHTPAWVRITKHLNSIGPARSSDAWRQTWKDLKLRVRSRARLQKPTSTLLGFREKRVRKLLGLPSPSHLPDTDSETVEEYNTTLEPGTALGPRAVSPRSVIYNLAEILARRSPNRVEGERDRNKAPTEETSVSSETNSILRELVQELKRSNELKAEQNVYLRELLSQLRPPTAHTGQDTNTTQLADSQTDINSTDILKEEPIHAQPDNHSNEMYENTCSYSDEMAVERTPVIKPVALSSLIEANSPVQKLKRVKVQSILRAEPKVSQRLVRLKDGTMVFLPNAIKSQANTNQGKNNDQMYVVCNRR